MENLKALQIKTYMLHSNIYIAKYILFIILFLAVLKSVTFRDYINFGFLVSVIVLLLYILKKENYINK